MIGILTKAKKGFSLKSMRSLHQTFGSTYGNMLHIDVAEERMRAKWEAQDSSSEKQGCFQAT